MRYRTGPAEPCKILNGKQCCNRNRICTVPCKRVEQVRSSSLQIFVRTLVNGSLTLPSDRVKLTLIWGTVQALFYCSWPCWLTLSLPNVTKGKFDKNPNFIVENFLKQVKPHESTSKEISFEWSHHRILSTDVKLEPPHKLHHPLWQWKG